MTFKTGDKKIGGRRAGTPNKTTRLLKDAILEASETSHEGGTVGYLREQAEQNPVAFTTLLGKVLPLQISADRMDGHEPITGVTFTVHHAAQLPDQTELPMPAASKVING